MKTLQADKYGGKGENLKSLLSYFNTMTDTQITAYSDQYYFTRLDTRSY